MLHEDWLSHRTTSGEHQDKQLKDLLWGEVEGRAARAPPTCMKAHSPSWMSRSSKPLVSTLTIPTAPNALLFFTLYGHSSSSVKFSEKSSTTAGAVILRPGTDTTPGLHSEAHRAQGSWDIPSTVAECSEVCSSLLRDFSKQDLSSSFFPPQYLARCLRVANSNRYPLILHLAKWAKGWPGRLQLSRQGTPKGLRAGARG